MNWMFVAVTALHCAAGVTVFSLLCFVFSVYTFNKTKLPWNSFVFRTAAMIPFSVLIWTPIATLLYCVIHCFLPIESTYQPSVSLLTGLIAPNIMWLSYIPVKPVEKEGLTDNFKYLFALMFFAREATVGYVEKIIRRQERHEIKKFVPDNSRRCVTKAFEYHIVEIAEYMSSQLDDPIKVFKIKNTFTKNWYLLRFLGHKRWYYLLSEIKADKNIIFPTWPYELGDRREESRRDPLNQKKHCSSDKRTKMVWGRRKTDLPYTHHFVLKNSLSY